MAIRNFYIQSDIDGRETPLQGGPRSKDGGMCTTLYQRSDGEIVEAVKIKCLECDGELITQVINKGEVVYEFKTNR